ncbi:aryl-alcohol oxidase 3 [Salvia divinorum]|uniref:indole-3-acetaldehyde oxidase n=1 Tax=Salvia divinorum TaxID=28513 RepID=A0ABD1HPA2_SALDI
MEKNDFAVAGDGSRLVFEVNGKRFEVEEVDPSTTLLDFLRSATPFKSVKLGCGEGGCGACVVVLSRFNPVLNQTEIFSVSSCLTLLCSLNGFSITTTEGLGNTKHGFHPIHQRFAGFHASQCGFCTPGFCMSFFSALANADTSAQPPPSGFSNLTASQAQTAVTGNLCRCTGYRPIADACKSFAADADIEDLGMNVFAKGELPPYDPEDDVWPYVRVCKQECSSTVLNSESLSWFTPVSLEELSSLVADGARNKLVVGNTGTGYYKEAERYDKYIDLRYIPELLMVTKDESGIEFGAAFPISRVISSLKEEGEGKSDLVLTKIAQHMERVASIFIRNSASIGGNLVMAQRRSFPSDIATLLLAVGSTVALLRGRTQERITMDEFLYGPPLAPTDVLLSVHIPFLDSGSRVCFESYRAAPRPLGNALPYLNAAFLADVSFTESGGVSFNYARLAFGAYGTDHATRAREVEEYLAGKTLTVEVLDEAVRIVKLSVEPKDGTTHPAYRKSLAVSFLFSFLTTFIDVSSPTFFGSLSEVAAASNEETDTAKQLVESSDYYPVGEPIPKVEAIIQASGEAVYVDDIPSPPRCLHGALVYSTKPLARVKGVSFEAVQEPSGIVDVISAKVIPQGGQNFGATALFGSEYLFADDTTASAGDIIAFVVARSQKEANVAARMAQVDYDTQGLDPPILTVEEAVENSSFFDTPFYEPHLKPEMVGDFSKGMAEADHKILSQEITLGSQYYFYMETQTALAIPDEDNCMVVYSSVQSPEYVQIAIARCLGVSEHNVRVITRRLGGAFGGKCQRAMKVATACALAAQKLRRPVRSYIDRNADMIIAGGRHPMKITYTVGFKESGKLTALHVDILIDAGFFIDVSPFIPYMLVAGLKKYDWGALSFDIKLCKTNNTSKSMMRAPGDVQGNFIAEAIVERVASLLSMEASSVREINFHTSESLKLFYAEAAGEASEYTLPRIWDDLIRSSCYMERTVAVEQFNRSNIWRKRGISCVPVVYKVTVSGKPGKVSILNDGSVVVEVGGIEMGQGMYTKVKQATTYALSLIKCDGMDNLIEKVRVVQSDTLSLVQGGLTGGSTTSEACCAAVIQCSTLLVERLSPLATTLKDEQGSLEWNDLIREAHKQSINLAANSYFLPESTSKQYLNYGAAVSEVEICVLTGEKSILRTDIIYDCGQSLNPAVDMGQIEGSFTQGVGFFMLEEYLTNEEGLVTTNSTWDYKIPSLDNVPKEFNAKVLHTGHLPDRVLSSKASGEPPLVLAASVYCGIRAAVVEARKQLKGWGATQGTDADFQLDVPATLPVVKQHCGLDYVEAYLRNLLAP